MTPRILIIAGSDSGGGAGIQADIKTVTMLGGHATTAITAITAQNTLGVQALLAVPSSMVVAQINSIVTDIGVDAVKIGMIGSAETAHAVADVLAGLDVPIVFDPVMVATSGDGLSDDTTVAAFGRLMRLADLVTPNLPELASLGGEAVVRADCKAVLIKGGHAASETVIDRLVEADGTETRWESPRINSLHTHGTGCTLASAIATNLAFGLALPVAVALARTFVRLAIHGAPGLGGGHGPMGHHSVRLDLGPGPRFNHVTVPTHDYAASCAFYRTLGLQQVVGTDDVHYARFESPGGATLSIEAQGDATIYLEHQMLDVEVARLERAGVRFDQYPTDTPWLWREARLRDPSGNRVCLYQAGEARRYPPWRLPDA